MFEPLKRMTPEQREAANSIQIPVALLASAGSGKTSVLVERYLNYLQEGIAPYQILAVTFTNEAAAEFKERILGRIGDDPHQEPLRKAVHNTPWIGTLHSVCHSILTQSGSELGLNPIKEIVDSFRFSCEFESEFQEWLEGISQPTLQALLQHFAFSELPHIARTLFQERDLFYDTLTLTHSDSDLDLGRPVLELLASTFKPFVDGLVARFQAQGRYTFDDLETYTLALLQKSSVVRTRLRSELKKILVDEFQDTSRKQWQILKLLVGEDVSKLFLVGDPKQSIYAFRQADPTLFQEATEWMETQGGKLLQLSYNFRSHPTLLEGLNQISGSLFAQAPFPWSPMLAPDSEEPNENPVRVIRYGPQEKTTRSVVQETEVPALVAAVQERLAFGAAPQDIACLFRNSDRIKDFASALEQAGIPVATRRVDNLMSRYSSLDLTSYFLSLADPLDETALVNTLRSDYIGMSPQEIYELCRKRQGEPKESLLETCLRERPEKAQWFLDLVEAPPANVEACLQTLVAHHFPKEADVFLAWLGPLTQESLSLFEAARRFRTWRRQQLLFEVPAENPFGVQLMTVHASKGLEFDHVFLMDALRQLPSETDFLRIKPGVPMGIKFLQGDDKIESRSYAALSDEARLRSEQEARRILYVAATRAKKTLGIFLPHPEAGSLPKGCWAELLGDALGENGHDH